MKKGWIPYCIVVVFLLVGMTSCHSFRQEGKRLQRQLLCQQETAEHKTAELAQYLQRGADFDSVRILAHSKNPIQFYIFNSRQLVYWSDNTLASDDVFLHAYDTWQYYRFRNAHAVGRWTKAGNYNILTLIPVKYAYSVESEQLRNEFAKPFRCSPERDITRRHNDTYYEIQSKDGQFLFSLTPELLTPSSRLSQSPLADSFSFRQLVTTDTAPQGHWMASRRVRTYFSIIILLFVALVVVGVVVLIRYRGFGNMRLRTRFMYVIMACVLLCFIYVFTLSVRYVQTNYEERQRSTLQAKCTYIQMYLQNLYYWDMSLTSANRTGLDIDLRDIAFTSGTDIHVYDNHGQIVGSSTPSLFTEGLLSTRMASEPFFSNEASMVQYEELGNTHYLCAYAPFYNGSFVQIGYIAVPSFVSEIEKAQEVDNLLARLLPPYLLVLFSALFASYWAARGMTAPLYKLTDKMRHFQIGKNDNHIVYAHHDEVGELVERYNAMVDQIEESATKLAKAEREGAWRTMARQIAHEINNPLTPMKLTIQQLQRLRGTDRFDAYFDQATAMLIEEVDNLARIASSFSTFAKQPEVTASEVDVAQKLSNVLTLFRNNDNEVPIRYIGPDKGVIVWADKEQISQVFTNILRNALQAMEGREGADIIVMLKEAYSAEQIEISFSDNGPGIAEEIQPRVFMPNFTTKNTGMGLGLAISKNIVEGTGGKICFETSEKGTTFFVYLTKKQ